MTKDDYIRIAENVGAEEEYYRQTDVEPHGFYFDLDNLGAFGDAIATEAAKEERARCSAVIRRLRDRLPEKELQRSNPGLIDAIIAIELLDQANGAHGTEDTP